MTVVLPGGWTWTPWWWCSPGAGRGHRDGGAPQGLDADTVTVVLPGAGGGHGDGGVSSYCCSPGHSLRGKAGGRQPYVDMNLIADLDT